MMKQMKAMTTHSANAEKAWGQRNYKLALDEYTQAADVKL
jgi:hypothetical protein